MFHMLSLKFIPSTMFLFFHSFLSYISFVQVLLSQSHRFRALVLLGRFLDMGPWAVDVVCTWALLHVPFYKFLLFILWCAQSVSPHCFRPCLLESFLMCSNCFKQVQWSCVKFLCSYGRKFYLLIRYALLFGVHLYWKDQVFNLCTFLQMAVVPGWLG